MKSITTYLPPASGYSDQPQGEVCPPVQTGGAASSLTCRDCNSEKDVHQFSIRRISKETGKPSYGPVCRACRNIARSESQKKQYASLSASDRRILNRAKSRQRRRNGPPLSERTYCVNQRTIKRGIPGRLTVKDVEAAWAKWAGKCWICGDTATAIDHFIPTNKQAGETNTAENIRPVCADCNHKRDWKWYGEGKAMKEASMLREIKRMLLS